MLDRRLLVVGEPAPLGDGRDHLGREVEVASLGGDLCGLAIEVRAELGVDQAIEPGVLIAEPGAPCVCG